MLPTLKTLLLGNMLLIAAIQYIDLPKAGALFNLPNLLSDLLNRKLKTVFSRFDFDGDGVISRKDMEDMALNFANKENFDPLAKEAVVKSYSDLFSFFTSAAGTKDDVPLTEKLLIESMKMQKDNSEFKKAIGNVMLSFVKPMKVEQEGFLSYNEFCRIFEGQGMSDVVFAKVAYLLIDTNLDGKVSVPEFYDAVIGYMCSDDILSTALFGLLY